MKVMRWKNSFVAFTIGCALFIGAPRTSLAATGDVYQLDVNLTGLWGTNGLAYKQLIKTDNIIRLALGKTPTASIPSNNVLALIVDVTNNVAAVTVFDTAGQSNLVKVADFSVGGVTVKNKSTTVLGGQLATSGTIHNGIEGGFLSVLGTITVTISSNSPPVLHFKGKDAIGGFQGVMLNFPFGVVITGGKVNTIQSLGTAELP